MGLPERTDQAWRSPLTDVCADCLLRNLIDVDTAQPISYAGGWEIDSAVSLIRYEDAVGKQAEVKVVSPAQLTADGWHVDSNMTDSAMVDAVSSIEDCKQPERAGILRRKQCAAGILFRAVKPREIAEEQETQRLLRAGYAVVGYGSDPKFKKR